MNELEALTVLSGAPLLGSKKVRSLLNCFGSALEAIEIGAQAWGMLSGFGPKIIESWSSWIESDRWKKNLELVDKAGATIIPFTSPDYPKRLLEISDFPIILYVKGKIEERDNKSIAIVGTRNASIYGREMAEKIAYELTLLGYTIVSGLARGIDTAAHCAAIKSGRSLAVIGSGLCDVYPRENFHLGERIAQHGALISEFPMAAPPDRQNFPQRNRIVSGLTLGTLLIEAPKKSGAMITMEKAFSQGRRLFVIPGRADNESFKGNLALIKEGKAQLIENAGEIAAMFEQPGALPSYVPKAKLAIALENDELQLLKTLPAEEVNIDIIVALTKLPIMKLNVLLMSLLLKGVIREYPGKMYKRLY